MKITAEHPPPLMSLAARSRMRDHADQAQRLYPGPIGELVARELRSWAEFGYVLGPNALLGRVVAALDVEQALSAAESPAEAPDHPDTPDRPRQPVSDAHSGQDEP